MDIDLKVRRIVGEQLDRKLEEVTDQSSFVDDLGADSLAVVDLVLAFEEAFEVDIPDEVAREMLTVGDVIAFVQKHAA